MTTYEVRLLFVGTRRKDAVVRMTAPLTVGHKFAFPGEYWEVRDVLHVIKADQRRDGCTSYVEYTVAHVVARPEAHDAM